MKEKKFKEGFYWYYDTIKKTYEIEYTFNEGQFSEIGYTCLAYLGEDIDDFYSLYKVKAS